MIYIHKDINFWKTKVKLPDSYLISTDIDDYEVGAYLPLSKEQEQANIVKNVLICISHSFILLERMSFW